MATRRVKKLTHGALQAMVASLVSLQVASSFPVSPFVPTTSRLPSELPNLMLPKDRCMEEPSILFLTRAIRRRRKLIRSRGNVALLSFSNNLGLNDADNEEEEEGEDMEDTWENDLSRLLNSRGQIKGTGQGGERRRKRDRIKEWMAIGFSATSSSPASSMVQPIALEDGSIVDRPDGQRMSTQGKFDKLFDGMPTLDEILTPGSASTEAASSDAAKLRDDGGMEEDENMMTQQTDDSWFEEEKLQLEKEYQHILEDMREKLRQQQEEDPKSVPRNADGVLEAIVWQDMKRVIAAVKVTRTKERIQRYELDKKSELDERDLSSTTDETVDQILREAAEDWQHQEAIQAEVDDFKRYEDEAFQQNVKRFDQASQRIVPKAGENLDQWALQSLENMLSEKKRNGDSSGSISDNLEQSIDELREELERGSTESSVQPTSMKEWQMYRAIATRLGSQNDESGGLQTQSRNDDDDADEEQIVAQLDSWKQYLRKEEEIRKISGLTRGPQMPFEWQEAGKDPMQQLNEASPRPVDQKSRRDRRREVNIKAVEAMEDLVNRSDAVRAESLRNALKELKAELEPRNYHDVEEETVGEELESGPVDLTGVFSSSAAVEQESKAPSDTALPSSDSVETGLNSPAQPAGSPYGTASFPETRQPQSRTSATFEESEEQYTPPEPPNTAFFTDESDEYSASYDLEAPNKLGTVDEQKLQAMYRRAGARTAAEQNAIRDQWEAFQAFEKESREQSGLSDWDDSGLMRRADVKYNISEVMKDDGDVDADKILSTIGPRPVRQSRSPRSAGDVGIPVSDNESPDNGEKGGIATEDSFASGLDPEKVSDSLYRSVSAIGGGRTRDDPTAKAKEKAEFEEFMQKEDQLRQSLDSLDEDVAQRASSIENTLDDESYAEEVLSSIGPRPTFKRARKLDAGAYSDQGGVLGKDDDLAASTLEEETDAEDEESQDKFAPEWLQKERSQSKRDLSSTGRGAFLGSEIEESRDDIDYDKNMRQLAEYERRRSGRQRQMGIDISDVLGRGAQGSDDYADYTYDNYSRGSTRGWGSSSFEARKANLIDYTELSSAELNNLMDFKDSVQSTGVSQYMPRINKPFKAFGAIFRLESALVDVTGLHDEAWSKVASTLGFRQPQRDEMRRAAVVMPDVAVREIFYWTNDVLLCKSAVDAHRAAFGELFDKWAEDAGVKPPESYSSGDGEVNMALGAETVSEQNGDEEGVAHMEEDARINLLGLAWTKTAEVYGFPAPSTEQIIRCSMLGPDVAVRDGFRWAADMGKIDEIVSNYSRNLRILAGLSGDEEGDLGNIDPDATIQSFDEDAVLELQYVAWIRVAEENRFEAPLPEEVLAASVLNDPDAVVRFGFGWTADASEINTLATRYREVFDELVSDRFHSHNVGTFVPSGPEAKSTAKEDTIQTRGPTAEEILETQVHAWKVAAAAHNFQAPSSEQIELTLNMSASETVRRLLAWTYNFNDDQIKSISSTYENALREASQKFLKKYNLKTEVVGSQTNVERNNPDSDELFQAVFDAWSSVARKQGYSLPNQEQILFAMAVGLEEAIVTGFEWTEDPEQVTAIAEDYKAQIAARRQQWRRQGVTMTDSTTKGDNVWQDENMPLVRLIPGVEDWIKSLRDVDMECGVVSFLDKRQVDMLLEHAALSDFFRTDKRVSSSSGYDRDSQQLLGAALRIERRPDHCVVFDSSPHANDSAGEIGMRTVALVGPYPRYELLSADSSAVSFDELTAMNIRRLFGERVYDQPMLDMMQNQPETKKKVKTRFWDDE